MSDWRLFSDKVHMASKRHRCIWCGQGILKGDLFHRVTGSFDGQFQNNKWHPECHEAFRQELVSKGAASMEIAKYANERPAIQSHE